MTEAPPARRGPELTERFETTPTATLMMLVAGSHIAAQVVAYAVGVRFDMRPLDWFMQYLDPVLLRTRLLESVFYLHSQPPLFNLFLGVVLKLFGRNPAPAFQAVYLLLGLTLACSVLLLQLRLGATKRVAFALALLSAVSPSLLLYSNWLFYSLPVATLLALSALLLCEYIRTRHPWYGFGFFVALLLVCLIRSSFHLVYFMAAMAVVLVRGPRGKTLALASIPLLLLLTLYGKNLVVFGRFNASSWMGMNAWKVIAEYVPREELQDLVAAKKLSPVALVPRFYDVVEYPVQYRLPSRFPRVPALNEAVKSTGYANFNNIVFQAVSDQYLRDGLYLVVHRPSRVAKGLLKSWFAYFKSSSDYVLLEPNRTRIAPLNRAYDLLFYGRIPFDFSRTRILPTYSPRGHFLYLFLFMGLPALFVFGARLVFSRKPSRELAPEQWVAVAFICLTIFYSAFVGNLLEAGENNRFRFETDPLSLALFGLMLSRALHRRKR
jgi:hypothetical protein